MIGDPLETRHQIVHAYGSFIIRTYCRIRFHIINSVFLETIEQHIPLTATVLDIGCGFGLFANYFALRSSERQVFGIDINAQRIEEAIRTAQKLGIGNVHYQIADAGTYEFQHEFDVIVVLDLLHHLEPETALNLIQQAYRHLKPGGLLIIKDVTRNPFWKRWFTYSLDKLMNFRGPIYYRDVKFWRQRAQEAGFNTVLIYHLSDYLPYPHVLLICHR